MSYDDFYETTSPFDAEVETFKDALRKEVKAEIQKELEDLRTQKRDMTARLANLGTLERAARDTQRDYERKLSQAEQLARKTVQKEGLRKLLELLREPRYRVTMVWDLGPKCGKCDENRHLHYTTPRGKGAYELCECNASTQRWETEETLVHEVARRNGTVLAWYSPVARYFDDDSVASPTVVKSCEGVTLEEMAENPREYGFPTEEAAAVLAAVLNKADAPSKAGASDEAWS